MDWPRILAYITGTVDQELLLRNEYLVAEKRILKAQLKTPLRLTDAERNTLAEIAHRLGRKALEEVANAVKPDTLLGWYRRLIARKFDGSKSRRYPGRPRIDDEIEQLVVRMAKENAQWGYDHCGHGSWGDMTTLRTTALYCDSQTTLCFRAGMTLCCSSRDTSISRRPGVGPKIWRVCSRVRSSYSIDSTR